ncbi:hypothetical protein B7988_05410 [Fibrobacter sp. UWB1]|nr:hypothetical protein B7988_05410 [Fibrobacter sp. UWB1]
MWLPQPLAASFRKSKRSPMANSERLANSTLTLLSERLGLRSRRFPFLKNRWSVSRTKRKPKLVPFPLLNPKRRNAVAVAQRKKSWRVARMAKVGDKIKIISMNGEPQYTGKVGVVDFIDDMGQIHGTWGGCAIIPDVDSFEIINENQEQKNA